jgi:hypothetical protein
MLPVAAERDRDVDSTKGRVIDFRTLASFLTLSVATRHGGDDDGVSDDYGAPGVPGSI